MASPYRAPSDTPAIAPSRAPVRRLVLTLVFLLTLALPWSRSLSCDHTPPVDHTGFDLFAHSDDPALAALVALFLLAVPLALAVLAARTRTWTGRAVAEGAAALVGLSTVAFFWLVATFDIFDKREPLAGAWVGAGLLSVNVLDAAWCAFEAARSALESNRRKRGPPLDAFAKEDPA